MKKLFSFTKKIKMTKLLVVSSCFLFAYTANLFSPLIPVASAAMTLEQKQACYREFNNVETTKITKDNTARYKACTAEPNTCVTEKQVIIRCTDYSSQIAANAGADSAEVAPLIDLACGKAGGGENAGGQTRVQCGLKVVDAFKSCVTNVAQNNAQVTAQCLQPKLSAIKGSNISVANVLKAVNDGRQNASDTLSAAALQKAKDDCKAKGGTYDESKDPPCDADEAGATVVCAEGALGWLLCPLAKLFIDATSIVADQLQDLLLFKPLLVGHNGDALKAVWSVVLNISNVALVIVFMVVVFSQATSVGLSAYGIKKLLPKLVAAAILVNLSFYICAFGIDVSNILGESVKGIIGAGFDAIRGSGGLQNTSGPSWLAAFWDAQIAGVAALIAVASGTLPLILPVVAAGVVAFFTAWFIVGLRVVLLTLLVVASPLAFVAWVLPNTAQMFTRWRKLFVGLLLMYPVVMAVFYGAALVSAIVLAT